MEKEKQGKGQGVKGRSLFVFPRLEMLTTTTTSLLMCFSVIVSSVSFLTMFFYSVINHAHFPNVFLSVAQV